MKHLFNPSIHPPPQCNTKKHNLFTVLLFIVISTLLSFAIPNVAYAGYQQGFYQPTTATQMKRALATDRLFIQARFFFAKNSTKIEPQYALELQQIIAGIKEVPDSRITISGYASALEKNPLTLSKKRGQAIIDFLQRHHIPASQIYITPPDTKALRSKDTFQQRVFLEVSGIKQQVVVMSAEELARKIAQQQNIQTLSRRHKF